jgi:hypothetical protein
MARFEKSVPKFLAAISAKATSEDRVLNPVRYREDDDAPDRPEKEDEKPMIVAPEDLELELKKNMDQEGDLKERLIESSKKRQIGKKKNEEKEKKKDEDETDEKAKKKPKKKKNEFVLSFEQDKE